MFAILAARAVATQTDTSAAPPSAILPQVTVTAQSESKRRELDKVFIPHFMRSHGAIASKTDQLARWKDNICSETLGLPAEFNAFVSHRLQEVGASVGAPVASSAPCRTNVRIIFETQPQRQLDEIVRHAPSWLGPYYQSQAKRFETISRTIQSRYATTTRGDDGEEWVDSAYGLTPSGVAGSRLTRKVSSWIVHAVIIADKNKIAGYTIGSISDYIAMLVLAQRASLDACNELPSIFDLMTPDCSHREESQALTARRHRLFERSLCG